MYEYCLPRGTAEAHEAARAGREPRSPRRPYVPSEKEYRRGECLRKNTGGGLELWLTLDPFIRKAN